MTMLDLKPIIDRASAATPGLPSGHWGAHEPAILWWEHHIRAGGRP